MTEIERKPTKLEDNDFVNIGRYRDRRPEQIIHQRTANITAIKKANRALITNCKPENLDDLFPKLSCAKCYQHESTQGLISDETNFPKIFKRYAGRRVLDTVYYRQHPHKHGDAVDYSVSLRFKKCPYCGCGESICFESHETTPELFDTLKKRSFSDVESVVPNLNELVK